MSSPTGSRCSIAARLVADGTAAELKRLVPGGRIHLEFDDHADLGDRGRRASRMPCAMTRR